MQATTDPKMRNSQALTHLRKLVGNIYFEPQRTRVLNSAYLSELNLVVGKIRPAGIVGFRRAASTAISEFSELIFRSVHGYERGCKYETVRNQVTNIILEEFLNCLPSDLTDVDVTRVEECFASWFSEHVDLHESFIPCVLPPRSSNSFLVGPVRFITRDRFVEHELKQSDGSHEFTARPLLDAMTKGDANWIAQISIDRCMKDRAQELADLSVDLALVGVQLAIETDDSKYVTRLHARTVPRYRVTLSRSPKGWSGGVEKQFPGMAFGVGVFEDVLTQRGDILESIGRRIVTFMDITAGLRLLETAWADAAYWFHEGLAEPLDTIAITKLETCIEVLLRAENTRGSERRICEGIEAFYGLSRDDIFVPGLQLTVKRFAKNLVRDRSRILHGSWSTLTHALDVNRTGLEVVAGGLLVNYTVGLDQYMKTTQPRDVLDSFLTFARQHSSRQRQARISSAINT